MTTRTAACRSTAAIVRPTSMPSGPCSAASCSSPTSATTWRSSSGPRTSHDESHQILYRHLLDLHDAGKRIDATIVARAAADEGRSSTASAACRRSPTSSQSVPHAAHAAHYAQIVRDKSMLRSLIDAGTDILRDAYDSADEPRRAAVAGRVEDLRDPRAPQLGGGEADRRRARGRDGADGRPHEARARPRRRGDRLHRSRHALRRPAQLGAHHPGGPAQHGENRLRDEHRRARRDHPQAAGAVREPRNGLPRTRRPPPLLRGPGQRPPAPQRHDLAGGPPAARAEVGGDQLRAPVHRRHAGPHAHRDRRRGPPAEAPAGPRARW